MPLPVIRQKALWIGMLAIFVLAWCWAFAPELVSAAICH